MAKYLFVIILFFIQPLFASWDKYEGEQLVLFSLAPGIGDQYPENCEEQKLPTYIREIANEYSDIKIKIIAIDPRLSQNPDSSEYEFLKEWEHEGITFRKDNIEIQFFNEYIPETADEEYTSRIEKYLLKILENGGVIFIGHHGQAYYAFEPFRIAYNNLNNDNIQMYICCADISPWSTPKVYLNNSCSRDELDAFFEFLWLHRDQWWFLEDNETRQQVINSILQGIDTSFIFYRDITDLPYKIIRTSDGSLHTIIQETAKAA